MALTSKPNVTELCICTKIIWELLWRNFRGDFNGSYCSSFEADCKRLFFVFIQDLNCIMRRHNHNTSVYNCQIGFNRNSIVLNMFFIFCLWLYDIWCDDDCAYVDWKWLMRNISSEGLFVVYFCVPLPCRHEHLWVQMYRSLCRTNPEVWVLLHIAFFFNLLEYID